MGAGVERPGWVRWLERYGWVVVVAGGLLAYHNCFEGQLFLDDFPLVPGNPQYVPTPDPLVPHPTTQRWLGLWSFAAGSATFGGSPSSFHAINLVIHLLSGVTLWGFVLRTLRLHRFESRAGLLATVIAGLWGGSPAHHGGGQLSGPAIRVPDGPVRTRLGVGLRPHGVRSDRARLVVRVVRARGRRGHIDQGIGDRSPVRAVDL